MPRLTVVSERVYDSINKYEVGTSIIWLQLPGLNPDGSLRIVYAVGQSQN